MMKKTDPHITSSAVLSAPCQTCGRRTNAVGDTHFVHPDFYCQECCPKCKTKTESHA